MPRSLTIPSGPSTRPVSTVRDEPRALSRVCMGVLPAIRIRERPGSERDLDQRETRIRERLGSERDPDQRETRIRERLGSETDVCCERCLCPPIHARAHAPANTSWQHTSCEKQCREKPFARIRHRQEPAAAAQARAGGQQPGGRTGAGEPRHGRVWYHCARWWRYVSVLAVTAFLAAYMTTDRRRVEANALLVRVVGPCRWRH